MVETVTATPSASSTSYYDDGMWHTYYPIKPQESVVVDVKQNDVASAAPTTSPTGVIAEELVDRDLDAGDIIALDQRAAATGILVDERTAPSVAPIAIRVAPPVYNVVSWNETTSA